jgi:hypothetical protein
LIEWRRLLTVLQRRRSCDGTVRPFDCSGGGSHGAVAGRGFPRTCRN